MAKLGGCTKVYRVFDLLDQHNAHWNIQVIYGSVMDVTVASKDKLAPYIIICKGR
jgi:hypothetical protein